MRELRRLRRDLISRGRSSSDILDVLPVESLRNNWQENPYSGLEFRIAFCPNNSSIEGENCTAIVRNDRRNCPRGQTGTAIRDLCCRSLKTMRSGSI